MADKQSPESTGAPKGFTSVSQLNAVRNTLPTKITSKQGKHSNSWFDTSGIESETSSNMSESSVQLKLQFEKLLAESYLEDTTSVHNESTPSHVEAVDCSELETLNFSSFTAKELTEAYESFLSDDFIGGENALQKLKTDESQWNKEYGAEVPVNEKLSVSTISGILGDCEISVSSESVAGSCKKMPVDEFFKLRSEYLGRSLSAERPNFGYEPNTPLVTHSHGALHGSEPGNVSDHSKKKTSTYKAERDYDISYGLDSEPLCSSTLSSSAIEKLLMEHLKDTTTSIAEKLVQRTAPKIFSDYESKSVIQTHTSSLQNPSSLPLCTLNDEIQIQHPQEVEVFLGSKITTSVRVQNSGSKRLRCSVSVLKIERASKVSSGDDDLPLVEVADAVFIGPNQTAEQTVIVFPQTEGNFVVYITTHLEDAAIKVQGKWQSSFEVICKLPIFKLSVMGNLVNKLEFGCVLENWLKRIDVQLVYGSTPISDLSVKLEIEEVSSTGKKFFLMKNNAREADSIILSYTKSSRSKLAPFSTVFKAPADSDPFKEDNVNAYISYLNMSIELGRGKQCLLQKIELRAFVGCPKLLPNFNSPVVLYSTGGGVSSSKTLELKNNGPIPIDVEVTAINDGNGHTQPDGVVLINHNSMHIEPEEGGRFDVIFVPSHNFEEEFKRKVVIHVQPGGDKFMFEVFGKLNCQTDLATFSDTDSSARTSVYNSTLSISTTHKELVWTTVPVGKSQTLSCRLRNNGSYPVKILLNLVDSFHSYKLLNEHGDPVNQRKVKLHSKECMIFSIIFCPTQPGAAYAKITVCEAKRAPDTGLKFAIPLYGYGGTFKLNIRDVPTDTNGCMWLNLGLIDTTMKIQFTLQNKGNLPAFVYIKHIPKGIGNLLQKTNVKISPSKTVIPAGSLETVLVILKVHDDDIAFITDDTKQVSQIGVLSLICGDEPTRQRIRRIRGKQIENPTWILDLDGLCDIYPGEKSISGLNLLDDPVSHMRFLYRTFQQHEMALTIENMGDRTLASQTCMGNNNFRNNSSIFSSLIENNESYDDISENSLWIITPSSLTLVPPCYASGCLTISSSHRVDQPFEISCPVNFLTVEPQCGIVPGMGETVVVITCDTNKFRLKPSPKVHLEVYLENDVKTVTVVIKKMEEATVGQRVAVCGSSSEALQPKVGLDFPHTATYERQGSHDKRTVQKVNDLPLQNT